MHQHFDAFLDIDWDHPDFAIDPTDERWILPEADVLGRHPWYQALPKEEQIRVGLYRQANVTKVGLQFEQILIAGLMNYAFRLPNGSPEFRYSTHEATEECHHTQMFQEFVNRSGPGRARRQPLLPHGRRRSCRWRPGSSRSASSTACWPARSRSTTCRSRSCAPASEMHPLLQRIMQIHVAEEARHIGFAHQYLQHRAPRLKRSRARACSRWRCR